MSLVVSELRITEAQKIQSNNNKRRKCDNMGQEFYLHYFICFWAQLILMLNYVAQQNNAGVKHDKSGKFDIFYKENDILTILF